MYFLILKEPVELAEAEVRALCEAYGATFVGRSGKTAFIDRRIPFRRLTLAHEACETFSDDEDLGRFRVAGPHSLEVELGRRLHGVVDLDHPQTVVRAIDVRTFGRVLWEFSQADYERRLSRHHVTLKPELARLLVNLSRVKEHGSLLDPFCGTGAIPLEAQKLLVRAAASDVSRQMVAACRRNGVRNAHVADIRSLHTTDRFDAIATDMPYGRGSLLKGKKQDVYEAAFEKFAELLKPGGYAAVMSDRPLATRRLHLVEAHRMRVHRSLDRYITVFRRLA